MEFAACRRKSLSTGRHSRGHDETRREDTDPGREKRKGERKEKETILCCCPWRACACQALLPAWSMSSEIMRGRSCMRPITCFGARRDTTAEEDMVAAVHECDGWMCVSVSVLHGVCLVVASVWSGEELFAAPPAPPLLASPRHSRCSLRSAGRRRSRRNRRRSETKARTDTETGKEWKDKGGEGGEHTFIVCTLHKPRVKSLSHLGR